MLALKDRSQSLPLSLGADSSDVIAHGLNGLGELLDLVLAMAIEDGGLDGELYHKKES